MDQSAPNHTAGAVIIGNEILSGKVVEDNARYLSAELRQLGVDLRKITVIPDEVELIASEIPAFVRSFHTVFTSGGVGPTHDDVTMEGVARGLGRRLVVDPFLEGILRRSYPTDAHPVLGKLAQVPEGARLIMAEGLKVPVVVVENIYILPGVPEIFRIKFQAIRERFRAEPFLLRKLYLNTPEERIVTQLNELVEAFPQLLLGSYPLWRHADYRVMLTLESKDADYLRRAEARLLELLPPQAVMQIE